MSEEPKDQNEEKWHEEVAEAFVKTADLLKPLDNIQRRRVLGAVAVLLGVATAEPN